MRPDAPRLDPHQPIDPTDEAMMDEVAIHLDASREELAEAVEKVGQNVVSVALYLNKPAAIL